MPLVEVGLGSASGHLAPGMVPSAVQMFDFYLLNRALLPNRTIDFLLTRDHCLVPILPKGQLIGRAQS